MTVTRRVDDLGRIVLPIEFRRQLGISERAHVDVRLTRNEIRIKPRSDKQICSLCRTSNERTVPTKHGTYICAPCTDHIKSDVATALHHADTP